MHDVNDPRYLADEQGSHQSAGALVVMARVSPPSRVAGAGFGLVVPPFARVGSYTNHRPSPGLATAPSSTSSAPSSLFFTPCPRPPCVPHPSSSLLCVSESFAALC